MKRILHAFSSFTFFGVFIFLSGFVFLALTRAAVMPTAPTPPKNLRPIPQRPNLALCNHPASGLARCHARITTYETGEPLNSPTPLSGSLGPVQLHTAYNLPCTPGGSVQSLCQTPQTFGPQTIAIVVAYHSPTIEQDLQTYSTTFGIPECTKANGCLRVVNQTGGTSLPVTVNNSWAFEAAMDVQVAHAICQTCKVLLVEANTNSLNDLGTAVKTAANLGATAISNSYGASEWSTETAWDSYFNHPGIAVTASTGDSGYGTAYPAASKYVVAVGGTRLELFNDNTYANESVWIDAGSGCSKYASANSWQTSLGSWSQTGCLTKRALADVAAVADPNTGAAVYYSPVSGTPGWYQVGGTSLSSPIIAGAFALAGGLTTNTMASSVIYANFNSANSHDIVTGNNGFCLTIMCKGGAGFDGPTGMGTPNGVTGFMQQSNTPTVTPTVTPTANLLPTLTPTPTLPLLTITPTPTAVPTLLPTQGGPDTSKPSVSITSPLNESFVPSRRFISVAASASDNVKVTRVRFYRNGALTCTRTAAPYTCSVYTGIAAGLTLTLTATANDAAGNTSSTSISVKTQ